MDGFGKFELRARMYKAIHTLVDEMTSELCEEDDQEIRQILTDEFRFWRRVCPKNK